MNKRTIRAAPGRTIVDPATGRRISDVPVMVDDSAFWRRRINDGDVVEVSPGAQVVTAGVDVQKDRIETDVVAHEPEATTPPSPSKSKTKN